MTDLRADFAGGGRGRAVMLAGNDILPDVHVLKFAHTVARLGLEVVALGPGGPRLTGERMIANVRIICPPVPDWASVSGWRYRLSAARTWFSEAEAYRRSLARWEYASRECAASAARDGCDAGRAGVQDISPNSRLPSLLRLRAQVLSGRRKILALRARPLRWGAEQLVNRNRSRPATPYCGLPEFPARRGPHRRECHRSGRSRPDVPGHRDAIHRRIMRDGELRERFSWRARADRVRTIYDELLGELLDEAWKEEALHVGGLLGRRLA